MQRHLDEIIVHCSASPPSADVGAENIRNYHVNTLGWDDIGYHYVIRRNGEIEFGRPIELMGAHCAGHNESTIGMCLIGGVDENKQPENNFTEAQFLTLATLLPRLQEKYGIEKVSGHRDYAAKACPSFSIQDFCREHGITYK